MVIRITPSNDKIALIYRVFWVMSILVVIFGVHEVFLDIPPHIIFPTQKSYSTWSIPRSLDLKLCFFTWFMYW